MPGGPKTKNATYSLRTTLAGVTLFGVGSTIAVSTLLIVGSTHLGRKGLELVDAVEAVRLSEQAEIDLLLHERTLDTVVREELAKRLVSDLEKAERFVTTPQEGLVLQDAHRSVDSYLAASSGPEAGRLLQTSYVLLHRFTEANVEQAEDARDDMSVWGRLAQTVGVGVVVVIVPLAALMVWWIRVRAFRPVLELAGSIERFAKGDRGARAAETGPVELRESARRFNEMAEALGRQREQQMAFLAGVAHDLRTPLTALKLSTALVPADARALDDPTLLVHAMQVVKRQVDRLDRMVGDFLDAARIEANELALTLETRDLRELAAEVRELFEATGSLHVLTLEAGPRPVPVRCDGLRVGQVLNNLVSNAIKYSPAGSRVTISVTAREGEAMVAVSDEGRGIEPDEQQRIFEPFRRSLAFDASAVPGVGLGLFVARRIAEAHGGRIEVESAPGRGSSFRLVLPAAGEGRREEPAREQSVRV